MKPIHVGDLLTCAETGKQFVATSDGFTVNYARFGHDGVLSEEGVDIREKRHLAERAGPFQGYIDGTGTKLTGWKGNVLGNATLISCYRGGWGHTWIYCWSIVDVHGGLWHGRNSGENMSIVVRPSKV